MSTDTKKKGVPEGSVLTPEFRAAFVYLFDKPRKAQEAGKKDTFEIVMLFPKEGAGITNLKKAMRQVMIEKFGQDDKKWPKGFKRVPTFGVARSGLQGGARGVERREEGMSRNVYTYCEKHGPFDGDSCQHCGERYANPGHEENAADTGRIAPNTETGIPECSVDCPSRSGEICEIQGCKPGLNCRPGIVALIERLQADARLGRLVRMMPVRMVIGQYKPGKWFATNGINKDFHGSTSDEVIEKAGCGGDEAKE